MIPRQHTVEKDALTERAEAALAAYWLERIESDPPPEPCAFTSVIPPAVTEPGDNA